MDKEASNGLTIVCKDSMIIHIIFEIRDVFLINLMNTEFSTLIKEFGF